MLLSSVLLSQADASPVLRGVLSIACAASVNQAGVPGVRAPAAVDPLIWAARSGEEPAGLGMYPRLLYEPVGLGMYWAGLGVCNTARCIVCGLSGPALVEPPRSSRRAERTRSSTPLVAASSSPSSISALASTSIALPRSSASWRRARSPRNEL